MNSTTKTVLIVGGVAVAVYLLTRPRTPAYNPLTPAYNPYANPYGSPYGVQPNNTPALINAGANALNQLIPAISNLFGGGSRSGSGSPAATSSNGTFNYI